MTAHQPVTAAEIAALLAQLRAVRAPARGGDPATFAAALTAKADLLARIADADPDDEPAHQTAAHARHVADTYRKDTR